ncbi:MAG TPA: cytochrome c maturation protein CcmE [Myxococcaceae bacterium]|nr:cytochrome c maturation protein CcmE [Myxococcaceae bacterium]
MTPKTRNRLIAVGALGVAALGLGALAFANIGENLVYYWSPSEMVKQGDKAYGATIRLGGVVKPGSIQWDEAKTHLRFRVADSHAPEAKAVEVDCRETPPQMFREGIGVVVEGTFAPSGVFSSNRLMVNHSNEYRPPKAGEKPADWKETVQGGNDTTARAP